MTEMKRTPKTRQQITEEVWDEWRRDVIATSNRRAAETGEFSVILDADITPNIEMFRELERRVDARMAEQSEAE